MDAMIGACNMTIVEYLHDDTGSYRYVGTIWGDDDDGEPLPASEWAEMVADMGSDGEVIDHPTNTHLSDSILADDPDQGGYYLQDNDIWYRGYLTQEVVLEECNDGY